MQPTVLALAGTDVALDDLWDRLDPPPCRPPLLLMPRRADVPVTDPAATAAIVNDLLDTLVGRRGFQALVKATDSPQLIVSVEPQLARFAILGEYVVHPDDWVFTSPNRIVVRYDLFSVPGNERTYWSRFAVLVRRGDTWKLTEDSVCEFVLLGSAACPGWTSDRGPTAQAVAGTL